jgi:2-C-methyl-D-erythritol 4-phosphate cytidylyltransferase
MNLKKLKDGIYYNDSIHVKSPRSLNEDEKRLTLCDDDDLLKNPRFLFVSMRSKNGEIVFDTLTDSDDFKWEYHDEKYISNKNSNSFIGIKDNSLVLVNEKISEWKIIDDRYIFNEKSKTYLSCNLDYQIELNTNKKYATPIYFSEYGVHYIKPKLRLDFDTNNLTYNSRYNIDNTNIIQSQQTSGVKNIGLLLIGGSGTRFDSNIKKQLYKYNSIPLFLYSLRKLLKTLDSVVIVTNSDCISEVTKIILDRDDLDSENIYTVTNDIGDRLESIDVGLSFIYKFFSKDILNIVIHDGLRPFIQEKHIMSLLSVVKDDTFYSQYYLNLTNGLLKCENNRYEEVDRNDFIEICTPVCANFGLFNFLFSNYIKKERRICWEIIPLLDLLKIKYELLKGSSQSLRKITTKDDIEDDLEDVV